MNKEKYAVWKMGWERNEIQMIAMKIRQWFGKTREWFIVMPRSLLDDCCCPMRSRAEYSYFRARHRQRQQRNRGRERMGRAMGGERGNETMNLK